jgi:hypothetical protein
MATKLRDKAPGTASKPDHPTWPGLKQLDRWKYQAAKPEEAAAGMRVLKLAGKVTRLKFLEAMFEMDEKQPGRGWREATDELEKFYLDRGLNLAEKPAIETIGD